ncbi:hypothetical protein SKAU_G00215570 [Synaphobranchus kaupii]|uniref:Uncharacterized protein n=1 Tax=Synaphobranchus kaupii TaxID=118154 RepID=A0A9Q1F9Y8_SYNKA|nr:hypothetical protein SKAU_G00215570 [Synaphobranchus kaupii]
MEESQMKRTSVVKLSQLPPDAKGPKPTTAVTSEEMVFGGGRKRVIQMTEVQKISVSRDAKSVNEKPASKTSLSTAAAPAVAATAAAAVAVVMDATPTKVVKQKAKKADVEKVTRRPPSLLQTQSPVTWQQQPLRRSFPPHRRGDSDKDGFLTSTTMPASPQKAVGTISVAESVTSTVGEKAEPGKAARVSSREETPIMSVEITKPAALPAPAEKAQAVV